MPEASTTVSPQMTHLGLTAIPVTTQLHLYNLCVTYTDQAQSTPESGCVLGLDMNHHTLCFCFVVTVFPYVAWTCLKLQGCCLRAFQTARIVCTHHLAHTTASPFV